MSEWLRQGSLVYALRQQGWKRGEPILVNDFQIAVSAQGRTPDETEALAERIRTLLSNDDRQQDHT